MLTCLYPTPTVTKTKKKDKKKGKKAAAFDSDDEAVPAGEEEGPSKLSPGQASPCKVLAPSCMSRPETPSSAPLPFGPSMQCSHLLRELQEWKARTMSQP